MKRIVLLFISIILFTVNSFAQWNPTGNNASTGGLTIGQLTVGYEHASTQLYMMIKAEEYAFGELTFRYQAPDKKAIVRSEYNSSGGNIEFMTFPLNGISQYRMSISGDGNIGIGTRTPLAKLDVRGKIIADEIEIKVNKSADFVFLPEYKLKPLSAVEAFVKENQHLPDVPSEKEMIEKGVSVNEMQIKLLQKVEELTLYVIEQDKQITNLKKELQKE